MKLTNIISVLMLLVYSMLTFVNVGIFNCGCTDSQQFVVLNVQTTCPPCSNTTESCCPHNEHNNEEDIEENEDDDCCSLSFQYIVVDQLNITKLQSFNNQPKVLTLYTLPLITLISDIKECVTFTKNHSPPFNLLKIPVIYLYGQLRL